MRIPEKRLLGIIREVIQEVIATDLPGGVDTGSPSGDSAENELSQIDSEIQQVVSQINSLSSTDPDATQQRKFLQQKRDALEKKRSSLASS